MAVVKKAWDTSGSQASCGKGVMGVPASLMDSPASADMRAVSSVQGLPSEQADPSPSGAAYNCA